MAANALFPDSSPATAEDHAMARVGPAVEAHTKIRIFRKQVRHFPLTFIAPLGT